MAEKAKELAGGAKQMGVEREARRPKKKHIRSLSITRGKSGGHVVRHEYESSPDAGFEPPAEHVFGKADGAKMMQHVIRHAGVSGVKAAPMGDGGAEGEPDEGAEGAGGGEPDADDE